MGWNDFISLNDDPILEGINLSDDVYYVYSYYAGINEYTTAVCDYGIEFSAAMRRNNFFATQFHPEKSATPGSLILKNFIAL